MTQPGNDFNPRTVDEQIEQLSPSPDQPAPQETKNARLIRHLRSHYQTEATEQHQRALERAWERIRQNEARVTSAAETPTSGHLEAPASGQHWQAEGQYTRPSQRDTERSWRGPRSKGDSPMTRRRVQGLAAFVTIAAITGLFVLLLHTFLPSHANPNLASSGTPRARASATPTMTPGPGGHWASIPDLTNIQQASPMIAPSNPQVVYEDLTPAGTTQFSLRRSDNAGATWHRLARPVGLPGVYDETSIVVSPLNPMTVFLTLTIYAIPHSGLCSPSGASNALLASTPDSGGPSCGVQFYSTNGGANWSRVHLPIAGAFGAPWVNLSAPTSAEILRPQGQRLYSAINPYSTVDNVTFGGPGARIIASDDGGKSWQLVDADIQASGQNVCDFTPMSTGSMIFAITQTGNCYDSQNSSSFLWRSNDGGTHWAKVGALPGTSSSIVLVDRGANMDPLIYIHTPVYVQPAGPDAQVAVSQDGGITWQTAPTAGLPVPPTQSELNSTYGPLAALSDGSVLNIFPIQNQTLVFAAWKPGDKAWHRVAPDLAGIQFLNSFFITPGTGDKATFWLITQNNISFNVLRYDQQ